MSIINAYIQQALIEPINVRQEFYVMKIENLSKEISSKFDAQTMEYRLPMMNSLNYTLEYLKRYDQILTKRKDEDIDQQRISQLQLIITKVSNDLHKYSIPGHTDPLFFQMKDKGLSSINYNQ